MIKGTFALGFFPAKAKYASSAKIVSIRFQFGLPCPLVTAIISPSGYEKPSARDNAASISRGSTRQLTLMAHRPGLFL